MRENEIIPEYRTLDRLDVSPWIKQGDKFKDNYKEVNTPLTQFKVRYDGNDPFGDTYYFYNTITDKCVGFFTLQKPVAGEFRNLGRYLNTGVKALKPHMGLAPQVQRQGVTTLVYTTFLQGGKWVFITEQHTVAASKLWDSLVKNDVISFYVSDITGKPTNDPTFNDYRLLGPKDRFKNIV